jgi:hypothetical protein
VNPYEKLFQELSKSETITGAYSRVVSDMATHDLGHVMRVVENAEKIAGLLGLSPSAVSQIKIAGLLHDIGLAFMVGRKGHAERSYEWVRENLPEINDAILAAIREHQDGAKTTFGKILTVADKLDICKERILPEGLAVAGQRQYAHLLHLEFFVKDKVFAVRFASDGAIDLAEMLDYYFTAKVLNSVKNLAAEFGLRPSVTVDGIEISA